MKKILINKNPTLKVLANVLHYAIFSNAELIRIQRASDSPLTVSCSVAGTWSAPMTLTDEQAQSLWTALIDQAQLNEYQNNASFWIEYDHANWLCRLDYNHGESQDEIRVRLQAIEPAKSWHDFGFSNKIGDDLLDTLASLKGLVLVAGYDESYKTAWVYALLNELAQRNLAVTTLEAPVIYRQPEYSQHDWSAGSGRSYASAFKDLMKQDPDIIYVDNGSQLTTEELITYSSSHLLIVRQEEDSMETLLARLFNDSQSARLLSALKLAIVIRSARSNCPHCLTTTQATASELFSLSQITGLEPAQVSQSTFQIANGCALCSYNGYQEQLHLFDIMIPDRTWCDNLSQVDSVTERINLAMDNLYLNSLEDAWMKLDQGLLSHREIIRLFS